MGGERGADKCAGGGWGWGYEKGWGTEERRRTGRLLTQNHEEAPGSERPEGSTGAGPGQASGDRPFCSTEETPRTLKALGSESSVQEPKSQAGLMDMSCARPAPVVPTGPQHRMVRRAEGDPLRGSVPSYHFRCPPTPGAQPARGGGARGIPTVHEVEQPAVRRVQIVRGHAVPVRGPVDAAVVLHVELLRACGISAQTCWALGPGPPAPIPAPPPGRP